MTTDALERKLDFIISEIKFLRKEVDIIKNMLMSDEIDESEREEILKAMKEVREEFKSGKARSLDEIIEEEFNGII